MAERQAAFYRAWAQLLEWMREYAAEREGVAFTKEADFPDYIYRMHRPYDLPTTVMVASLSDPATGLPVLMTNASPRHAVFKEDVLHPYDIHDYRTLTLAPSGEGHVQDRRPVTPQSLPRLALS